MKYKKKTYTSTVWNPQTREWNYYKIPLPEEEFNFSGLLEGTKTLSLFVMAVVLIGRVMGVI